MDNPARAVADAPPRAAKGVAGLLKNKPPVFYIVLVAGVLAAAWLIRKREAAQAPADPTATTQTGDGSFSPDYTPTDGALAGGYGSGGGGAVDQTGAYQGGPIPLGNGYIWDPSTGSIYGALPDAPADPVVPLVPSVPGGGGPPNNGGVEAHYPPPTPAPGPVWTPIPPGSPPPPPPPPPQGGSSVTLYQCGGKYPNSSERGCYRVVRIYSGTHKGKWHYYGPSDDPKIKVSDNPNA